MLPLTSWEAAEGSRRREEQPEVSWSTLFGRAVKESYRYVVVGYSMAKGMGIGKFLASEIFLVGRYLWVIYFYPEGKNREDDDYVSVFSPFELILVDQSGKGEHIVKSRFGGKRPDGPLRLWGYKHMDFLIFLKKEAVESSDFLQNDSLVFECAIRVFKTCTVTPIQRSIHVPPSTLGCSLGELLRTEMGSDIVFVVADETFKTHKLILAARSPVFRAQFFSGIGDPNLDRVDVEDIEPPVFKAMLQFIYSDDFPDIQELAMSIPMCTPTIFLRHLLAAADRYWLDRLKRLCELKLSEEITVDTLADNLVLAERHRCLGLKAAGLEFIGRSMVEKYFLLFPHSHCRGAMRGMLQTVAVVDGDSSGGRRGGGDRRCASRGGRCTRRIRNLLRWEAGTCGGGRRPTVGELNSSSPRNLRDHIFVFLPHNLRLR
ncbi:unnamed protein product [Spirodela intermedia]|uniref:Uncharacterized protein n=1 Tax=Spirodela intermedia TaxID=51605 RepID=A0A7I8L4A3_SPIIN|nr:unnamed protein product [Spirodela intermedia]